jgi:hypothetical protein
VQALTQFRPDDEPVRILLDKIRYAHAFVLRVEELHTVIQRCWQAETNTELAAPLALRVLIETEKTRAGVIARSEPAKREQSGLTGRIPLDFP